MKGIEDIDHAKILKSLMSNGGEYSDLYYEKSLSTSIICDDNKIEKVISGIDAGVGLRLIKDLKTAYAYTNDISEKSLVNLAVELSGAFSAKGSKFDLSDLTINAIDPKVSFKIEIDPAEIEIAKKIDAVNDANDAARCDKNVSQVKVIYRDSKKDVFISNLFGNSVSLTKETRTQTVFIVHVVSAKGEIIQTGYEPMGGTVGFEIFGKQSPIDVAKTACARANLMLDADRAPGGTMTVVLASDAGGTMIHEAVGHGLEADLSGKNLSVYSGKIGEKVASGLVTVIDDSTIPTKRGSFVFDDEGTPSQKTVLVDGGVLKNFMYDKLSSIRDGCKSSGNGRRESYRSKPIPRMTNTMIASGKSDPKEIIASVDRGLLVKKMGGGQVNTINGQFVFEVSEGYIIENGIVKEPVRGAILTGNGPEVLMDIDMVGDDLGFGIGTCGKDGQGVPVSDAQPTLRIPNITVGGKL